MTPSVIVKSSVTSELSHGGMTETIRTEGCPLLGLYDTVPCEFYNTPSRETLSTCRQTDREKYKESTDEQDKITTCTRKISNNVRPFITIHKTEVLERVLLESN